MNPYTYRLLQDVLARCSQSSTYLDTFYTLLFERSPAFRQRFRGVDMERQKKSLTARLPLLLALPDLPEDSALLDEARQQHAQRHQGGADADYALWLDTLCEAFSQCDPLFDEALEAAFRQRLHKSMALLRPVPTAES